MKLFLAVVVSLTLVSCGKPKLTEEQKKEFVETLESAGRSQRVAQSWTLAPNRNAKDTIDQSMLKQLQAAKCAHTVYKPESIDSGSLIPKPIVQGLVVEGKECPIAFKYLVTTLLTSQSISSQMEFSYSVPSASYQELNDVYGLSLAGEMKGRDGIGKGSLSGSMLSKKLGTIPVSFEASAHEAGGEVKVTWDFPTYGVELRAVAEKGKVEYTLNGESLTHTQFAQTLAKGGPAFTEFGSVNTGEASTTGSVQGDSIEKPPTPQPVAQPPHPEDID